MQEMQEKQITEAELEAINQLAPIPLKADEVYTFSAKIIDDKPTGNNRVWTKEWQQANVEKFVGAPMLLNHVNDVENTVARIYHAEYRDDGIYGDAFVALNEDKGQTTKTKIGNTQYKNVSLGAKGRNEVKDGLTYIYPSELDRVYEVSFVAVGGCETCQVINESQCDCEDESYTEALIDYAKESLAQLTNEYIRLAGFTFGTKVSKATYQNVAESVSPQTLNELVKDMRNKLATKDSESVCELPQCKYTIADTIEVLRSERGV